MNECCSTTTSHEYPPPVPAKLIRAVTVTGKWAAVSTVIGYMDWYVRQIIPYLKLVSKGLVQGALHFGGNEVQDVGC